MPADRGFPLLARATRARVIPTLVMPVFPGASVAWIRSGFFSWSRLALTLGMLAFMQAALNVLTDLHEERSGAENAARRDHESVATGSGVFGANVMSASRLRALAGVLLLIAATFAGLLVLGDRTHIAWMVPLLLVVAHQQTGRPLRCAYVGRGLGEAGAFLTAAATAGIAAYAQTGDTTNIAYLCVGLVPGLMAANIALSKDFLHWRADRESKKHTVVATLGPAGGVSTGRILVGLTVIGLAVQSLVSDLWPPGAVALVLVAAPILVAQARVIEESKNDTHVRLLGAALGASFLANAGLAFSHVVSVWLR